MSHAPTIRALRESLLAQSTSSALDEVTMDTLRQDIARTVREIRQSINRVMDFASRGLVAEAAALARDFPDLAEEAAALAALPHADPSIVRTWKACTDPSGPLGWVVDALPREAEIDLVGIQSVRASELRSLLDIYRSACLRQESITVRLRILKKLRSHDPDNRMWLDQVHSLEREWLRWATERSRDADAERAELEEILAIIAGRDWLASIPRGLHSELESRLKPMRAEVAGERFAEIAQRIHLASARLDWEGIARLEAEWAGVHHDTGRMPDAELDAPVRAVFDALSERQRQQERSAEFAALCDALGREMDAHPPGAHAPNEQAIERSLQAVRDFGAHAPEGLVERAVAHLDAIRDARARRSKMMLLAGLVAASVAALALALAIRVQAKRAGEASSRDMLLAHVEAGRWKEAEELSGRMRAGIDELQPETVTALEKHDAARASWLDRQGRVARAIEDAESAIGLSDVPAAPGLDRAAHAAVVESLAAIRPDVDTEEHRERIATLDRRLGDLLDRLDAADRARVDAIRAACDEALDPWGLPDRWIPSQSVDPARWADYEESLSTQSGRLADGISTIRGFTEGESDLARKKEEIEARMVEARSRRTALDAAARVLAPAALGRPPTLESEFIARLKDVVSNHGAILVQQGDLAPFEAALATGPAWLALEAWRERSWVELNAAIGDFQGPHPPAAAAAANAVLDAYLGAHPRTPLRAPIERFREAIGPAAVRPVWEPKDLQMALELEALAGLERVRLFRGEERFYYRRAIGKNDNPLHNAVGNLADLKKETARLGAAILPPGDVPAVPVPEPVSQVWEGILAQCRDLPIDEVLPLMLTLLEELRAVPETDPLLQLYGLVRGVELLEQSGLMPEPLAVPVGSWRRDLGRKWREARDADWAALPIEPDGRVVQARERAREAIRSFPDIAAFLRDGGDARLGAAEGLRPYLPVGVLMMEDGGGIRRIQRGILTGDLVVVRPGPTADGPFELVEVKAVEGVVDVAGSAIPGGPVIVFQRSEGNEK
jgi:hypothetical protein